MIMDKWLPITPSSPSTLSRSTQRRSAPPARPHPIAGYRAQHHNYHQQQIRASGIDLNTQLHLQRALHRSQSFSRLPDQVLRNILQFVLPDQIPKLGRVCRRLYKLSKDARVWKCKLDWLAYKGPLSLPLLAHENRSGPLAERVSESSELSGFNQPSNVSLDDYAVGPFIQDPTTLSKASKPYPRVRIPPYQTQEPGPPTDSHHSKTASDHSVGSIDLLIDRPSTSAFLDQTATSSLRQRDLLVFDPEPEQGSNIPSSSKRPSYPYLPSTTKNNTKIPTQKPKTHREIFIYYFTSLIPYIRSLLDQSASSILFIESTLTPLQRAELISTITRLLCNPFLAPKKYYQNPVLIRNLKAATEIFESELLREFERFNDHQNESGMKSVAEVMWALSDGVVGAENSVVQNFIDKREIFYDTRFNPLDNLRRVEASERQMNNGLDFGPMESYIRHVLETIKSDGSMIARIFPPGSSVLLFYIERLATDVLSEYIVPLLSSVQSLPHPLFLITTVKIYTQLRQVIEVTLSIEPKDPKVSASEVESIIHTMYGVHLGDYLQEESEWVKDLLERICSDWNNGSNSLDIDQAALGSGIAGVPSGFLSSTNPTLMKQKVLSSFKTALMLPVSVVPKTVSYSFNALSIVGAGALNTVTNGLMSPGVGGPSGPNLIDYQKAQFQGDGMILGNELESWLDDTADEEMLPTKRSVKQSSDVLNRIPTVEVEVDSDEANESDEEGEGNLRRTTDGGNLKLFLSLDTSLKIISADRESFKRVETFQNFRGMYGARVKDTLEEVFIVLLRTLGQKHIQVAFEKAFEQMSSYKPNQLEVALTSSKPGNRKKKKKKPSSITMAPVFDFFELVHLADTIQQMTQVYFDTEISRHIDMKDFLNLSIREKRTFESNLDDCVAKGLNLVIDLLIDHLDNLLVQFQSPLDFCPVSSTNDDPRAHLNPSSAIRDSIEPTLACQTVIDSLENHCQLVQGSTDRHILEVFYQEIGLRLHGILCKHLKRSIISIEGARQVKRDLECYQDYIFKSSIIKRFTKENEILTNYFNSLKLVGDLYSIESPKQLGKFTRDLSFKFSNGTFNPDELYQFVKRRADWKKIQRDVDREIYGIGKEDCIIT